MSDPCILGHDFLKAGRCLVNLGAEVLTMPSGRNVGLGQRVNGLGISTLEEKVSIIKDWPVQETRSSLRTFGASLILQMVCEGIFLHQGILVPPSSTQPTLHVDAELSGGVSQLKKGPHKCSCSHHTRSSLVFFAGHSC